MKREHLDAADALLEEVKQEAALAQLDAETQKLVGTTLEIVRQYQNFAMLHFGYAVLSWACFIAYLIWDMS